MPAPFEAPVTDPYGFRWRGLLCITTPRPLPRVTRASARPATSPSGTTSGYSSASRCSATNSSPISTTAESTIAMSSSVVR